MMMLGWEQQQQFYQMLTGLGGLPSQAKQRAVPAANGKPIRALRVASSIRLIKMSLCHQPSRASSLAYSSSKRLIVWRGQNAHRAHVSCSRHNLSSRQPLKDTNIASFEAIPHPEEADLRRKWNLTAFGAENYSLRAHFCLIPH